MRNVLVAASITDAALVRNLLLENGIESQLVEKIRGDWGVPYTEVWVFNERDGDRAVELIRNLYSGSAQEDSWSCAKCAETNDASFEVCWRCGAAGP
jgi:hypothetical protein